MNEAGKVLTKFGETASEAVTRMALKAVTCYQLVLSSNRLQGMGTEGS